MVDITAKPYFSYDAIIDKLMVPLYSKANIQFLGFSRDFSNGEQYLICRHHKWAIEFFAHELYKYSPYENVYKKPSHALPTSFNMWDHLPYILPQIYHHNNHKFGLGHGLTIIQQHEDFADTFVFSTNTGNNLINNFYLNEKEELLTFVKEFYAALEGDLHTLEIHTFTLQGQRKLQPPLPPLTLSLRQKECAALLAQGATTKEIGKFLNLSPRTIETHINILKGKVKAKNRIQLIELLNKFF